MAYDASNSVSLSVSTKAPTVQRYANCTAEIAIDIVSTSQTNSCSTPNALTINYNIYFKLTPTWAGGVFTAGTFRLTGTNIGTKTVTYSTKSKYSSWTKANSSVLTTTVSNTTGAQLSKTISQSATLAFIDYPSIVDPPSSKNVSTSITKKSSTVTLNSSVTAIGDVLLNAGDASEPDAQRSILFNFSWNKKYCSSPKMQLQYSTDNSTWHNIGDEHTSTELSYTWTPTSSTLLGWYPNTASGNIYIRAKTIYGSTQVGESDFSGASGVKRIDHKPTVTITDAYAPTVVINQPTATEFINNKYGVNVSVLTIPLTGTPKGSATIKSYTCEATVKSLERTVKNTSATSVSFTSTTPLDNNNPLITATITDSRGFTATATNQTYITPANTYIVAPPIVDITAYRYSSDPGVRDLSGTNVHIEGTIDYFMEEDYTLTIYGDRNNEGYETLYTVTRQTQPGFPQDTFVYNLTSVPLTIDEEMKIFATVSQTRATTPPSTVTGESRTVTVSSLNIPLTIGKSGSTFGMTVGGVAKTDEDLLETKVPTRFMIPVDKMSTGGTLTLDGTLADYVVDYQLSGDWEWRIWASGKTEIWLYRTVTPSTVTKTIGASSSPDTTSNTTADTYRWEVPLNNFPFTLTYNPVLYAYTIGMAEGTTARLIYPISIVGSTTTMAGTAYFCSNSNTSYKVILGAYWIAQPPLN